MSLKIEAETKVSSDPCVLAFDGKLYIGTEDGYIHSFDDKLSPVASWPAHAVQLFALAAGGGAVYSSSNDGSIRVWSAKGDKITEIPVPGADVSVLHVSGNELYTGDEAGTVKVYEDNTEKAMYNVLEEVKDLALSAPFLFTVRDLDVTVTEIKPDESRTRFVTRHTMEGRAPLRLAGPHLLCMARGGNNLALHDSSVSTVFKKKHEVKVSDMIVTSLAVSGDYAWTGGWDGVLRRWKITTDQLEDSGSLELGACINGLAASQNSVFAIVAGGRVVCVKGA